MAAPVRVVSKTRRIPLAPGAPLVLLATSALLLASGASCGLWNDPESARSWALANAASGRIHKGMPLADAEQALAQDAWRHLICEYPDSSQHVFLYGTRTLDKVGDVWLRADGPPGEQVVVLVGKVENDQLRGYTRCRAIDLP